MKFVNLSNTGIKISQIGLGAMPLSLDRRPNESDAIKVIHRALDLGINLIDTADSYCIDENDKHHNELLIAKALKSYNGNFGGYSKSIDDIVVATKGGIIRPNGDWIVDNNPELIKRTIKESYEALGGSSPIKLWQLHSPNSKYSLESVLEPVKEAINLGLIKHVGVSNFTVKQIEQARKILPIVSVQNIFNPWNRRPEQDGVLEYCEKNGLIFLPWSPVGGFYKYKQLLDFKFLTELAEKKNCSVYSLILSWLMHKSSCVVPIPGASKITSIEDSVKSIDVKLSKEDMNNIDKFTENLS